VILFLLKEKVRKDESIVLNSFANILSSHDIKILMGQLR
jgi:hypothetical protein